MRRALFFALSVFAVCSMLVGGEVSAQEPPAPPPMTISVEGPFWADPCNQPLNQDSNGVKRVCGTKEAPSSIYYKVTYGGGTAAPTPPPLNVTLAPANITLTVGAGAHARVTEVAPDPVQPDPASGQVVMDVVLSVYADDGAEGTVDLAVAEGTAVDSSTPAQQAPAWQPSNPSTTVFMVDNKRPTPTISIPSWEANLGNRLDFDPSQPGDPGRVEFIVTFDEDVLVKSFTGVTIYPDVPPVSPPDVTPMDVKGLWEDQAGHLEQDSIFSAVFPEGYCYFRQDTITPIGNSNPDFARRFSVIIHPRRDCTVAIRVRNEAAEDISGSPCVDRATGDYIPKGNLSLPSDASEGITVNDAPRVHLTLQPPYTVDERSGATLAPPAPALIEYHSTSPTLVWKLQFSEPVSGFGTGDVGVNSPLTDPAAAGGTKAIVVTGTQAPGQGGSVFYVGVSDMTYAGTVNIFLSGGEACRQLPQAFFHHPSNWCQPNWPSGEPCSTPLVHWDGSAPDRLTVVVPPGLPQPPQYSGSYETANPVMDAAGTVHDNVRVNSVSWSNDRGGGGSCLLSDLGVSIVGPSTSSTVNGPVTYTVHYNNLTVPDQHSIDVPKQIADTNGGVVDSVLDIKGYTGIIDDLNVFVDIDHEYDEDLTVSLISPSGTSVELFSGVGADGEGFKGANGALGMLLDDEAPTPIDAGVAPFNDPAGYQPQNPLDAFDGEPLEGVWKLRIVDPTWGKTGTLNAWHLQFKIRGGITLDASDVTLNTTGNATGDVSVSGSDPAFRTVTISNISGSGTIGISLAGATAWKGIAAGSFQALPAGPSQTFSVGAAGTGIAISEPSLWLSPTPGATPDDDPLTDVTYTVTYTGATNVTLKPSDITLIRTGTASGVVSVSGTGNLTRTVTVRGITGSGTLSISIAAGTATGAAGPAPAVQRSAAFDVGTPTFGWRTYALPLKPGTNVVTFTAGDATAQAGFSTGKLSYVLTVNCTNSFLGEFVEQNVGQYTSIALDASGNPRISYYDQTREDLRYAAWDGQNWIIQSVDGSLPPPASSQDVGRYSSIKLDSAGDPHIAYYDATNGDLRYAYWKNNGWHRETVDGTAGINDNQGRYASLALDANGFPRIAYYDALGTRLKYAAWTGTSWAKSEVDSGDDVGQYASLALDSNGLPRIAYYDATNRDLKYAAGSDPLNPVWTVGVVDSVDDVGRYASLALDSNGLPRIAYHSDTLSSLMYIEGDDPVNPTWSSPVTVDAIGSLSPRLPPNDPGQFISLKLHGLNDLGVPRDPLDPNNNRPRIAYYDASNGDLKYAEFDPAGTPQWATSVLDDGKAEASQNTFDVGRYCSLALDVFGNAHVSYYDVSNRSLKYRYRSTGPRCIVTAPSGFTNTSPLNFTITFSTAVSGLEMNEIVVTGGTKNSLSQIAPNDGTTYRLVVSPTGSGAVTCQVPAGVARAGTVDNLASNTATVNYDGTRPTVTIDQDYIGSDPVNSSPIYFTVVFSEPVSDFDGTDVVISGSAGGTKTANVLGHGSYYTVAVTGMTSPGTVVASIPADRVHDAAGNTNYASTSSDNSVWYDGGRPTVTINQAPGQKDPTNSRTINFVAEFSEPITNWSCYTFLGEWTATSGPCPPASNIYWVLQFAGDAKFNDNNGASTHRAVITPLGMPDQFGHYSKFNVAVSGMTTDGTVIVSTPAGAAYDCDQDGSPINASLASTSSDNSVVYDATPPGASINRKSDQPALTSVQPIRFTVVFTEDVTGFDGADVDISGTADLSAVTKSVTGSGKTYTVEVSGVKAPTDGTGKPVTVPVTVVANIAPGRCTDLAGNDNLRATSQANGNVVQFDGAGPTVTVEQAAGQSDSSMTDPVNFTVTFSEPVTDFTAEDVTIGGTVGYIGSPSVTVTDVSGNNRTVFNVAVGGFDVDQPGSVTASVAAGVAHDALGNANQASTSVDNKVVFFPEQCSDSHIPIPDNTPEGAESIIDLTGFSGTIKDVNVKLSISHGYDQDLKAYLIGPDGTEIELFTNVGGNGANFTNTVLDDEAVQALPTSGTGAPFTGVWKPKGLLSAYDNKNLTGVWKLKLVDDRAGAQGTLQSWCLQPIISDNVAPSCTISGPASPTNTAPIDFRVAFSEPVVRLRAADFSVTGGTITGFTGSGANYTVSVTPPSDGVVQCSLNTNVAHDTCGNYTGAPVSASVNYRGTPPSVTVNQAPTQADPTAVSPISFAVVFNEPVTGFTANDVVVGGTAGGTKSVTVTGSGASYNVAVAIGEGATSGTVTLTVPAGVANDYDGNPNVASTSTDNTVTYDITKPAVTVEQDPAQADPTSVLPILFTATFTKPVADFTASDVVIGGTAVGTKTVTITPNDGQPHTTYSISVAMASGAVSGSVIASVPAGAAHDVLGNANTASTSADNTVWYDDNQRPAVTVNQAQGQADPTNVDSIQFAVTFNKPVDDFTADDVTVTGLIDGAPSGDTFTISVSPNDGQQHAEYIVTVSGMTQPQVISAIVEADKAHDAMGKGNVASTSTDNEVTFDNQAPGVALEQAPGQPDPTAANVITFAATFTEPVNGFSEADVAISGTAFGTGATKVVALEQIGPVSFNVRVSGMTQAGTVVATISAGAAVDAAGNANTASTSRDNVVTYDTPPTVTIQPLASQSSPTNASPIRFRVTFSEVVVGFATGKVALSGTAFGPGSTPLGTVTGSGAVYDVAVSGMTRTGTVVASIPAGAALDLGGNANVAAPASASVDYDITVPTVTIDQASTQADPVSSGPIVFGVVFSKPVSDFDASDVTISGTAGGAKTVSITGGGRTYVVSVSGMTSSGTVIATIGAGVAHDVAGNGNTASISTDNTVTYDVSGPNVTVNQAPDQADPTSSPSVRFAVVFSKPVTGFASDDVTVGGTAGGAKTVTVSGSGTTYVVTVAGLTSSGTVTVSVPANRAYDSLGNGNVASTSTDNTVTYDISGPTVTVNQAAGQADPTRVGPINYTVVFSKPVTGFTGSDVTIGGDAGATTAVVTGNGTTYNVAVSGMKASGVVTVSVPAGVAVDSAGNSNFASMSTDNSVTYDDTPPAVTITEPTTDPECTRNVASLKLSGTAEDAVGVAKVEWYTSKGAIGTCTGTTSWSAPAIDITGGQDTVTVVATDTAGNTSTDTLTVRVAEAGPGAAWRGLAMVSLPIIPDETDPQVAIGFSDDYWVMYKPQTRAYVKYPGAETWFNPASATPGRGFWTLFNGTVATPAGIIPPQNQPATIKLQAGWNLIGQPFVAPVTWSLSAIKVKYGAETKTLAEARDAGWIKDYAWGWQPDTSKVEGGAYYLVSDPAIVTGAVGELAPWCAYWIKANIACDLVLPAP